jgi:ribosomal protein S8
VRDEISGKCRMHLRAVSLYSLKKRGYLKDFKYSYENKTKMELEGITRHVGDKTNLSQKWE